MTTKELYKRAYHDLRSLKRSERNNEYYDGWAVNRYFEIWLGYDSTIIEAVYMSYQNRRIYCDCEFCERYQN